MLFNVLYLDVKLEVLVHGVDVVKDVVGDARDDPHQLGVVQLALKSATDSDVLMFSIVCPALKPLEEILKRNIRGN